MPFYLTGGTAVSRAYYNHRYSDDLDFFVNNENDFHQYADIVIENLKKNGFEWNESVEMLKSIDFISMKIHSKNFELPLKIDFVNDIPAHFGEVQQTAVYYKTDSIRNILSNKVTAVYRQAGKDIADIHEICIHERFSWDEIIKEADAKEAGLELTDICEIMNGIPENEFKRIKWKKVYEYSDFKNDIKKITEDMLEGKENSLCISKENLRGWERVSGKSDILKMKHMADTKSHNPEKTKQNPGKLQDDDFTR